MAKAKARKTTKKVAKKPVARKAAKKVVKKVTKKVAKKPVKKVAKKVVKKVAKKAVKVVKKEVKLIKQPKSAVANRFNKSQINATISEATGLSKKQVVAVFEELNILMSRHLKRGGAGEFVLPGLLKCTVKRKPATKARKGINPFTGEEVMFKAKPARNVVKVRPLKALKEMV